MKISKHFITNPKSSVSEFRNYINYIDTSSVISGKLLNIQYLEEDYPSRAKRDKEWRYSIF